MGNFFSFFNFNVFRFPFIFYRKVIGYFEEGVTTTPQIVVITPKLHEILLHPNKTALFHFYDTATFNYLNVLNPLTSYQWTGIEKSLRNLSKWECTSTDLIDTIKSYNEDKGRWCNYKLLGNHEVYDALLVPLPFIVESAMKLKDRLARPVKVLRHGENATVFLTRRLACSLLANAFLCTIEKRNDCDLPSFDFFGLYHDGFDNRSGTKMEKLKCIVEYFRIMKDCPEKECNRIISFERRSMDQQYYWQSSEAQLCKVTVVSRGRIEENGNMVQVDFANQYVGGGVLSNGAVQEEIRFSISPELICARLLSERLQHNEVLIIKGTRIFSGYSGYASSFKFRKLRHDPWSVKPEVDQFGREESYVVCMDALHFQRHNSNMQYHIDSVDRELHKSYVGFLGEEYEERDLAIATGNWGCGAFNGDPQLKFLIQWLAASAAGRPEIKYYALDRTGHLASEMEEIQQKLRGSALTIDQVYYMIEEYSKTGDLRGGVEDNLFPTTLFEYIKMLLEVNGVGGDGVIENQDDVDVTDDENE